MSFHGNGFANGGGGGGQTNGYANAETLSPTADTFSTTSSRLLASSMSSLQSATTASRHTSHITRAYRQASTLFLTRRLPEALSTLLPLVTPSDGGGGAVGSGGHTLVEPAPVAHASRTTRVKVWSLYLTVLNAVVELDPDEGKDAFGTQEWRALCNKVRDGDIWDEVVRNGYHGVEGEVDSDVVINLATLLLAHARTQEINQKKLENFLAAASSPNFDLSRRLNGASPAPSSPRVVPRRRSPSSKGRASGADTPRDLNARVKILELYTLHVLLRNNEWDYAREFISVSSVLDEERRDAFLQALESLREDQAEAERLERDEAARQEEQLRRDLDEARRLRAENEDKERRRLEEQRHRRQGSEVDYGIEEATPSFAGSSVGRGDAMGPSSPGTASAAGAGGKPSRTQLSSPSKGPKSRPKGKNKTTELSFGGRANMLMARLGGMMKQLDASLRANPMLLMRLIGFVLGLIIMFGRKGVRERIQRILGSGWGKIRATAGMGVKVSYI